MSTKMVTRTLNKPAIFSILPFNIDLLVGTQTLKA